MKTKWKRAKEERKNENGMEKIKLGKGETIGRTGEWTQKLYMYT